MKYVLDTHTHTLVSGHAYSTLNEMVASAEKKGLELLAITEHSMTMPGTCHEFYFQNTRIIDRNAYPVELMLGVELNIMDEDGNVDMAEPTLKMMDICIASIHHPCYHSPITMEAVTNAYIHAMQNPYVDIIGHPDDGRFPLNYEKLVLAAKEYKVLLEVNASSFEPASFRTNARENYIEMLNLCKKYEVPIIVNSDAHIDLLVGNHEKPYKLLAELDFPERLVANHSVNFLKSFLHQYK